ncbi:LysM peptidoglycan-binding domain-containing protein [Helcococcus ovis]|uniref:LysM peptidoglycan-binding domain-containing protein n=3 Tax=Peptoniphilaceae TaxID=1570339 RepID=A0A4R9C2E9_9FIRM|nr:LysM peptidoglycan-binding domain-containing protein [Helcococcus ovis]TFF65427.1 LysM peptidoglycan-binding domain-containing protein [Helcococcus ovis]
MFARRIMGYKIKNKKKFNRFLFLLFMTTILFTYLFTLLNTQVIVEGKDNNQKIVIVKNGDTLWNIAENLNYDKDIRETVYEIKAINQLSSSNIKPGFKLYIPN